MRTKGTHKNGRFDSRLPATLKILGVALVLGAGFLSSSGTAEADWHLAAVKVGGATVRDCYHPVQYPSTDCKSVGYLPEGSTVHIVCQRVGQAVYGASGMTEIWDYVVAENANAHPAMEGLVSDSNIYTGTNDLVAEICQ
ncbi:MULTISPECIES: hypothetical protein [Nocardia]|uniref:hypothetical protein n=1 Tax=Nocardia TaxID=1817 RepID=UPI001300A784|nr:MULTISPECIES: hypothetical protein [Nocardia]